MRTRWPILAGAAMAGALSITASGYSLAWQVQENRLLATRAAAQLAPLPVNLLPPGTPVPPAQAALTSAERLVLERGLWREPLAPKLFNTLFADAARNGASDAELDRLARLLERLGWRYTPAQQNLLIRALVQERFAFAVDRADALLRRQKQVPLAHAMLAVMEGVPQVHGYVVDKLIRRPRWRRDYLADINPQSAPAVLDARVKTLATLLRAPGGVSREEIAPSLVALAASGRTRAAYSLWASRPARSSDGDQIYDPRFREAAAHADSPNLGIPFEWQMSQDFGHATQLSADGVTINWDRRGVPTFLSQTVPVRPGGSYTLLVRGRTDGQRLQALIAPALVCGTTLVRFEPSNDRRTDEARFAAGPLPAACDTGVLTINGGVDTGSGEVTVNLIQISLQPATEEPQA